MSGRIYFKDFETEIVCMKTRYKVHTSGGYGDMMNGKVNLVVINDISYFDRYGNEVAENERVYQSFLDKLEEALEKDEVEKIA